MSKHCCEGREEPSEVERLLRAARQLGHIQDEVRALRDDVPNGACSASLNAAITDLRHASEALTSPIGDALRRERGAA